MKVLILDNYDSFTFNLYQYAGEYLEDREQSYQLDVKRNDESSLEEIKKEKYDRIIISPGPGNPSDPAYFGICADLLKVLGPVVPSLGVCLGMQGMAYVFGSTIKKAKLPMHGKTSVIKTDGKGIFRNLAQELKVMRYHSLIVAPSSLADCFIVSAWTGEGAEKEIMGIRHKDYPKMEGIQFHPESFATESGKEMIANFLET